MTDRSAPPPIAHHARANIFQKESHWSLGATALERTGGEPAKVAWPLRLSRLVTQIMLPGALDPIDRGGPARFPYAEIADLRVYYDPTQHDRARYRCDLRLRSGQRASILSSHVVSTWASEDRAATYRPLVQALVSRVAKDSPGCRFWAGKRPLHFWGALAFLAGAIVLGCALITYAGAWGSAGAWAVVAAVAGIIPFLLMFGRKNRPRRFDPTAIPEDVLPSRDEE